MGAIRNSKLGQGEEMYPPYPSPGTPDFGELSRTGRGEGEGLAAPSGDVEEKPPIEKKPITSRSVLVSLSG